LLEHPLEYLEIVNEAPGEILEPRALVDNFFAAAIEQTIAVGRNSVDTSSPR